MSNDTTWWNAWRYKQYKVVQKEPLVTEKATPPGFKVGETSTRENKQKGKRYKYELGLQRK